MTYIVYKGNCYQNLCIHFSPRLNGADFFKILELVDFPVKDTENILLKYALTELVTNSVRALHERKRDHDVVVELAIKGNYLKIVVTDRAGGFDLSKLPIRINDDAKAIDITSGEFQAYREKHAFNRFGIGLISAKMALDAFHLVFIDEDGHEAAWRGEGTVAGTRITAAKRIPGETEKDAREHSGPNQAAFVSRNQRYSIFSKARINNSVDAYLVDISDEGIKLLLLEKDHLTQGEIISVSIESVGGFMSSLVFCAVVRWVVQESPFWQIGSEFVRDAAFPLENLKQLVRTVAVDPRRLGGLVVIEGT
jgi:hypothetical protein